MLFLLFIYNLFLYFICTVLSFNDDGKRLVCLLRLVTGFSSTTFLPLVTVSTPTLESRTRFECIEYNWYCQTLYYSTLTTVDFCPLPFSSGREGPNASCRIFQDRVPTRSLLVSPSDTRIDKLVYTRMYT